LWDKIFIRLREKISDFYGTEDTILYAAFDANGGLSLYLAEGMLSFQIV
jgi:hypothetical protein